MLRSMVMVIASLWWTSSGELIDGDQLLYILATARQRDGLLKGPVVGTVMSNLGLENALKAEKIEFRRAKRWRSVCAGGA